MLTLLCLVVFMLLPGYALAWGPLTHSYLAHEIFSYASLLPAGVAALLARCRQDFLYGNLMADMIIGKKYLPYGESSHDWDTAFRLLDQARTSSEKAFVYGYLCHLAADTVAHETLTDEKTNVGHTWAEVKADGLINKMYWVQVVTIKRAVQKRHDLLLKGNLARFLFSFKTNKRIYKGILFLSLLNLRSKRGVDAPHIRELHFQSVSRMIDVLVNKRRSAVLRKSPL